MNNKLFKFLFTGFLLLGMLFCSFAVTYASGEGGGSDPVAFEGAYLTKISGNSSTTGKVINAANNIDFKPVIKLVFTKNVVSTTVWGVNSRAFILSDSNGKAAAITVSRIPDEGANANPDEKRNIFVSPVMSLNPKATYTLIIKDTLTAKNGTTLGSKKTVVFTVKADTEKPVITGTNNLTIKMGASFDKVKGVKASDNLDGNLTSTIKISGTVNSRKKGIYTLTYTVTDKSGNKSAVIRKIAVK